MAIKVPGNPFGVEVQAGSTQDMGLQSAPESEFSARKQFEGISGTFAKVMEDFQKDIDETVTRDNMMALNDAVDYVLNNQQTGALNRKGKDALASVNGMSLSEEVQDELKRRYDAIAKNAYNKRQQEALSNYFGNVKASVQQKIASHVIKQQGIYRADVRTKEMDNALKGALSGDPEAVKSSLLILKRIAEETARENGLEVDYANTVGKAQAMRIGQMLDNNDIEGAKAVLAEAKKDMSASDYQQSSRLISVASKQQARLGQIANAEKIAEDRFSEYGVAKSVMREMLGSGVSEGDWELAMKKAGNDASLAAQIVSVGVDKWDTATKEEKKNAEKIGEMYRIRSNDFSKQTVESLVGEVKKLNPNLSFEDAYKAAQNIVAKRQAKVAENQMNRDRMMTLAFDAIRKGQPLDSLDPSFLRDMSDADKQSLQTYQDRMAAGALVTNPKVYWELSSNPQKLKSMSDSGFIALAKELSPQKYTELSVVRAGLRSNQYSIPKEAAIRQMVVGAVKDFGIKPSGGDDGKMVNGFILDLLTDRLEQKQLFENNGQSFTKEQVEQEVSKFMKTEFASIDGGWAWLDSEKTGKDLLGGKEFGFASELADILDAGITEQGNFEPNDVSRTRLMMTMYFTPSAPLPGANKMVDEIKNQSFSKYEDIVASYKRHHGNVAPSDDYIVRVYFRDHLKQFTYKETK